MLDKEKDEGRLLKGDQDIPESEPIEPGGVKLTKLTWIRWLVFFLLVVYVLLTHYHAAILTAFGRYLMFDHPLQPADLIVCLAGSNIERGLETADIYQMGMAPKIFIAKEQPLDGYALIQEKGVGYPLYVDLLRYLLEDLGVPSSAILSDETPVSSTLAEAELVREIVETEGFRSIIVVTSAYHTRRTWLTYKKVFDEMNVQIRIRYSRYSEFHPADWWKNRVYLRTVVLEYQKLIYYWFHFLL
ncbi:MAG: YdcF family protein [Deltaproteobacteria bacterium]|nr:YdcF family protein [Deltaproteobacteria bacterium]